jgi:hypothetical protein
LESLNVPPPRGRNGNAFQIGAMAVWLISQCRVRLRLDQLVSLLGDVQIASGGRSKCPSRTADSGHWRRGRQAAPTPPAGSGDEPRAK